MTLSKLRISIPFLLVFALAGYGFTFDFQEWAKNLQKQKKSSDQQQAAPSSKDLPADKPSVKNSEPESGAGSGTVPSLAQPMADTEIVEIQNKIQQITEQTKIVEQRSVADRVQLQKVLQQVQIQKKLVDSLKVPKQPVVGAAVNTDEIIRQAKLRLIAEDVRRTQEALKTSKAIATVPKPVQIIKTTER